MKNYTLKEYADLLSSVDMLAETEMMGRDETVITYLTYDSRAVTSGTLFICKGAAFKEQYLENAIRAGAVAYVSEVQYETETMGGSTPCRKKDWRETARVVLPVPFSPKRFRMGK